MPSEYIQVHHLFNLLTLQYFVTQMSYHVATEMKAKTLYLPVILNPLLVCCRSLVHFTNLLFLDLDLVLPCVLRSPYMFCSVFSGHSLRSIQREATK